MSVANSEFEVLTWGLRGGMVECICWEFDFDISWSVLQLLSFMTLGKTLNPLNLVLYL